ncbi:sensor domain-containing protein [Yinghuangia aomiensis]|uniref:histidine kinase n=1 Tax=Yinghuangia aomiensis TaxID=676205 RepID=A0ABP9HDY1_9ACTN
MSNAPDFDSAGPPQPVPPGDGSAETAAAGPEAGSGARPGPPSTPPPAPPTVPALPSKPARPRRWADLPLNTSSAPPWPALRTALRILREPFRGRSLGELLFGFIGFPIALVCGLLLAALLFGSTLLSITIIGVPILCGVILLGRPIGALHRGLARGLLGKDLPKPAPFRPKPGFLGWIGSAFGNAEAWRGIAFVVAHLPVSFAALASAWTLTGLGGMLMTNLIWAPIVRPTQVDSHGVTHDTPFAFGDHYFDGWGESVLVSFAGLAMVVASPWVLRGILSVDVWLMRALLGPTKTSARMQDLEESRAIAVDDSAARLRRIERDLHDGAQARIVALAMHLGQAQENLDDDDEPVDVDKARTHVDSALGSAKLAIAELRDLARGIHPPVLDDGLDAALATLTAGSRVPIDLYVDVEPRPPAALESIAYFCTAELLTNAQRYSGARRIAIDVVRRDDRLIVTVFDDGRGGAFLRTGGGLAGLVERVRTVDGTLTVGSPEGGPTEVRVVLPLRGPA